MTDDELLEALGAGSDSSGDQNDITVLRHVRSSTERRAADVIAEHKPCADFERFQTLFVQVESDLQSRRRVTSRFGRYTAIHNGDYFILGGQIVYVAEVGATLKTPDSVNDARLRVIYANGTESNLLLRSLQRALYKDNCGRRISDLA
ncbi:MAG: hypothetical protein ACYCSH_01365 [Acidithiobacillus sp.]|uniref:hypothetical protein n=1 Tax=Acidithiobacillus ferrooxidans TaxID=920 RepID=UPI000AD2B8E9|nr:hypothetical protein [Acidithiobacillus ferrooxidans]